MIKVKNVLLTALVATFMVGGIASVEEASVNANAQTVHVHHAKKHSKKRVVKKHVKKSAKKHVAKKVVKKSVKKVAPKKATKTKEPKVKELAPKGVTPKGYQPHQVRHLYGNVWEDVTDHSRAREINGTMYNYGRPTSRGSKSLKKSKDGRYYFKGETGRVYIGAGDELAW